MKKKPFRYLLIGAFLALGAIQLTQAATLVSWDLGSTEDHNSFTSNGSTTPDAATYAIAASGVVVSDLAVHGVSIVSGGNLAVTNSSTVSSVTQLDLSTQYTGFTLSATSGNQLELTSLNYNTKKSISSGAPNMGVWGYRVNEGSGWNSWVLSDPITLSSSSVFGDPDNNGGDYTWDFMDFSTTGTVEFGFWAYNGSNTARSVTVVAASGTGAGAGLIVKGSVEAVPEPSTYAMLLAGLFLLYWQFKRRRALA